MNISQPKLRSEKFDDDDDDKQGTCMLIDVAIAGNRNVIKKGAEKILKYKDLIIEIQRM